MKQSIKFLLFFTFLFLNNNKVIGQELNFESMIIKTWIMEKFEQNGKFFPPKEGHKNDTMIFNADKTTISTNGDSNSTGTWQYDEKNKLLIVIIDDTKAELDLKVIEISQKNCVLELENPANNFVKIYMIPK